MIKIIKYTYIIILLALLNTATACVDDFDRIGKDPYVEGIAELSVELNYEAETSRVLTSRAYTGGEAGNAISNIESLVMLVYDGDELYRKYDIVGENITPDPDITNVVTSKDQDNRLPEDKNPMTGEPSGDDKTGKVTFNMKLQSGQNYFIYAVANMGTLSEYVEEIKTRDGLKNISRSWDPETLKNNSEMFGVFSLKPDRDATDKAPLEISALTKTLHSWVRRLASKVTVAFDGSELYNGVEVYVTDIYLKDIPKNCFLGKDNSPGAVADGEMSLTPDKRHEILYEDGGHINIQTLPSDLSIIDKEKHLHLCREKHAYLGAYENNTDAETVDKTHSNIAPALFFYENKQGMGKSKKQDALNDNGEEIPDNRIDFPNPDMNITGSGWKDEKPFGTYVEVKGFYRCTTADGHVGSGPIVYRFMLGQDVEKDYNATRNTHYQLTLAFKGYGNDADWHIEYEENRGMYSQSPLYISYLYNKKMVATVKVVGRMNPASEKKLVAHIIDKKDKDFNPELDPLWRPCDDDDKYKPLSASYLSDEWPGVLPYYYTGTVNEEGAHQTFLSLRQTKLTVIPVPGSEHKPSWEIKYADAINASKNYYTDHQIGDREYEIGNESVDGVQSFGSDDDDSDGTYTVTVTKRDTEGHAIERIFKIPFYTRAKELVTRTGFTGNNPYYSYPRKQRVKLTASIWDSRKNDYADTTYYLNIVQVRRILNPKGVWRKSGSTTPFHVTLMELEEDRMNSEFKQFNSDGVWSAEVLTDPNDIITLTSTTDGSGEKSKPQVHVKRIQGSDEKPVDFKINFTGKQKGCAIIRVRYHDYSCEHDIFCRVGYEPIPMGKNGTEWSSYNVDHFENGKAIPTDSPLDEGSLFRRNSQIAITSANNKTNPRPKGDKYLAPLNGKLSVIDSDGSSKDMTWDETNGSWSGEHKWVIDNNDYQIATIDDYYDLVAPMNDRSFTISKAYGIVYGDDSEGVQTTRAKAYGYSKYDGDKDRGMMGIIVFDSKDGSNIFFPIGTELAGRRKGNGNEQGDWNATNRDFHGTLRYATRSAYLGILSSDSDETIKNQPLFYDLYRRPGAVYWCYEWKNSYKSEESSAFDMNFFTMGFEGFQNGAAMNAQTSDACFIRLVRKKTTGK